MPFDALNLSVITAELKDALVGGKINKITQPEKDEICINVFNKRGCKLLVSASSSLPRIHLTEQNKPNPANAPAFCMVLRKHLTGGTIVNVTQQPFERVVVIEILSSNELGDSETKYLICEVVGKSSNVFLTNGNYKILDCLKRVPLNSLADRPTMIGQTFEFLSQDKVRPDDYAKIEEILQSEFDCDAKEILKNKLLGVAYQTLNEIVGDATRAKDVSNNFKLFFERLQNPSPCLVTNAEGKPCDVTAVEYITQPGEKQPFETLNEAYDVYFETKDKFQRHNEKTKSLSSVVKSAIHRIEKKTALQTQALLDARDNEQNRIFGELILSNIYLIKKGDKHLETTNYYDNTQVKITLDELMTPQQNAQKYFKKYAKQKKTVEYTKQLLEENKQQLVYLKSILNSLRSPLDPNDIEDITTELQNARLIKKPQVKGKQKPKVSKSKPLVYKVDGWTIYVGKNNIQNDKVTFEIAKGNDLWLHTQDITSSHTIIVNPENKTIPDKVIQTAAEITAHFSEASESSKISVFYTPKKNVKKPNKSPLGFVNILAYQTCIVDPNEHTEFLCK
ncbi:MAG: fibronectin/fibrinogen-binding protein [Clostridiales bacterium]|nr:fibronectin/fibrinogen-binding protein [Clostridiales bacterium]